MDKRIIVIMFIVLLSAVALADRPTYINVTISERASQNVTYAEFFDLEENVYDSLVVGWINVTNPSNEVIYDVMVELSNLSNLQTNVTWMGGKYGVQSVFTDLTNDTQVYGAITSTPQPLIGQDLDHDNQTDYIWVNDTYLMIDISSDYSLFTYNFPGAANLGNVADFIDVGDVPITSSTGRVVGWFNITSYLTVGDGTISNGKLTLVEAANPDYVVIHIPELEPGNASYFTYNATPTIAPPLNLMTNYTHAQLTKVLAGECFNVTQFALDEFYTGRDLNNVNISMQMLSVDWNGSSFDFSFGDLQEKGDWTNVTNGTFFNSTWYWGVNGGDMTHGTTYNISYQVCAPDSVPNSSTYPYLLETLSYVTNGTVTGITLDNIRGRSDLQFNFTKRIDSPTDTLNNPDVTWEVESSLSTPVNISYNITKVSLWVTSNYNPNGFTEHKKRWYPATLVNDTKSWNSVADLGEHWYFNYTDGSSATAPPPIIWMIPYYFLADVDNQIIRLFETRNGDDYYMKYIYVVNGYWLEIQKNVTNIAPNQYNISLFVRNRGNGYTPAGLVVTIYDFVPEEFSYSTADFNPMYTDANNVSGAFNGTAMYWDVSDARTIQNASFAPVGRENSTWSADYVVNGSGDYRVSELYIVGLDPRLVDGAPSHEIISVASSLVSESAELVYVLIVLTLIVVNVVNYVTTKRKK